MAVGICRGLSERVGTGLTRALYATYVSYLPKDKFAYEVPAYGDARGVFVEMLKTPDNLRERLYAAWRAKGYDFPALVHPSAWIAPGVILGDGVQVMAGVVIQPGCAIGENSIVNTRAGVDHDCSIGCDVHVAPGATLCGAVTVEYGAVDEIQSLLANSAPSQAGCIQAA